jgi:hypothetical protein
MVYHTVQFSVLPTLFTLKVTVAVSPWHSSAGTLVKLAVGFGTTLITILSVKAGFVHVGLIPLFTVMLTSSTSVSVTVTLGTVNDPLVPVPVTVALTPSTVYDKVQLAVAVTLPTVKLMVALSPEHTVHGLLLLIVTVGNGWIVIVTAELVAVPQTPFLTTALY